MLRKLIEVLIIFCFISVKKEADIVSSYDKNSYVELKSLIGKITSESAFMMKKDFSILEIIRNYGNLAAHQTWVALAKNDFEPHKTDINVVVRKMLGIIAPLFIKK